MDLQALEELVGRMVLAIRRMDDDLRKLPADVWREIPSVLYLRSVREDVDRLFKE